MMRASDEADPTFRVLASLPSLNSFRNAFEAITGLPLLLAGRNAVDWGKERLGTGVCANLKNGHPDCGGCLSFPEPNSAGNVMTFRCPFGVIRTAVPLRVNGDIVAYLWTGWITHERPSIGESSSDDWEPVQSTGSSRVDCTNSIVQAQPLVNRERYEAMIELLTSFAACAHPFTVPQLASRQSERCVAVAQATKIIADEYHQNVSLPSVAKRCNLTSAYFSGLFKRSMGATFTEYLTRVRVEKAKELLASTEQRVSEIAFACGFGSQSQFNRMFHRLVGTSPSAFRASFRQAA